jgi:hypothetical protein
MAHNDSNDKTNAAQLEQALRFCLSVIRNGGVWDLSEKIAVEKAEKALGIEPGEDLNNAETVLAYVSDSGDESVGIFGAKWAVECPWCVGEADEEAEAHFRAKLAELYAEFSDFKIQVHFSTDRFTEE